MYNTLAGDAGFRKGMDLYFERHDGHAVTCDDFRFNLLLYVACCLCYGVICVVPCV